MKPKPTSMSPAIKVRPNGTVQISRGRKLVAFIAPEIFTDGWAKNAPSDKHKKPGFSGIIPLAGGERIGLQSSIKASKTGAKLRFTLTPLDTVRAIHVRVVVNLPYKDWQDSPYKLGKLSGRIPTRMPKNNRVAEAQSSTLTLGPSPAHKGLVMRMKAPGLYTVLQDNRQWTPYLHAFVNRHEPADPPWKWEAGKKKVYGFTLTFGPRP